MAIIARGSRAQPPLMRELIEEFFEQTLAGIARHSRRRRYRNLRSAALTRSPMRFRYSVPISG
jgi:hypothetical protein